MHLAPTTLHLLIIAAVAVAAHLVALGIRRLGRSLLKRRRSASESKVATLTGFATSSLIFVVYFAAIGFALQELGVSLTTYMASASVIGLAVSFGSQGIVQDVIQGVSLVVSDLLDVGDLVEIGGKVGIVQDVQMRFTVLVNFAGAYVYIPNRSITSVINYRAGAARAFLDVGLPASPDTWEEAEAAVSALAEAAYVQFPGILLLAPKSNGRLEGGGRTWLRLKFRIWPGQGAVLEQNLAAAARLAMKALDPDYADWMVVVHYRAEPPRESGSEPLPRPALLLGSEGSSTGHY